MFFFFAFFRRFFRIFCKKTFDFSNICAKLTEFTSELCDSTNPAELRYTLTQVVLPDGKQTEKKPSSQKRRKEKGDWLCRSQ